MSNQIFGSGSVYSEGLRTWTKGRYAKPKTTRRPIGADAAQVAQDLALLSVRRKEKKEKIVL